MTNSDDQPGRHRLSYGPSVAVMITAGLSWALLSACVGDRCDEGQARVGATCYSVELGTSPADAGDGSAAAQDGSTTATDGASADGLAADGEAGLAAQGEPCSDDPDCQEAVRFCLVIPPKAVGYCTKKDCDVAKNDCPQGTQCIEVSLYVPGEPNLCVQM